MIHLSIFFMQTNNYVSHILYFSDFDEIVSAYFQRGYQYPDIVNFLATYHDIKISLRTLKRKLQQLGLKRKKADWSPLNEVRTCIRNALQTSGQNHSFILFYH